MPQRPDTADYRSLFLADTPMMDMRAPAEYRQGAFPNARSLPLMSDDERARVGTCYKQQGQQAAIALGHELVSGRRREERLQAWSEFARANPEGYLYCFRGGLRSEIVQQWLLEAGIDYPRVSGGYKAMRRFLIDELERCVDAAQITLVCGKTGTGKTRVINQLARAVDLEGLAGHRGSTFGQLPQAQPGQIDFENSLSIALLKLLQDGDASVYLEDEGRLIGRVHLPESLLRKMQGAPMLVVEQSLAERIDVVVEDYVLDLGQRYSALFGAEGPRRHRQKLQDDLLKIRKRLGGERQQAISALMDAAFDAQWLSGDLSLHRHWIAALLEKYYDPMYEYQLTKRSGRVLLRGDRTTVLAHLAGSR